MQKTPILYHKLMKWIIFHNNLFLFLISIVFGIGIILFLTGCILHHFLILLIGGILCSLVIWGNMVIYFILLPSFIKIIK